ncbi:hypothetical protein A3A03_02180 [Candidatus Nomurabacteria bacterium RIFCSPLOWO2_01_FULL_40_18]|uniref:Uncharacterized protein n=1 Tax=Candidatus Nomurabacteria bacterium RIFCSPLOWO2_01_FULL_40_18 TaxID=1801773 RepID=A0A1F6XLB1_9BACT|nr:MAG: hypothetical protein A3A03_02180 [Candidatus Nomurabacteria bacterium RIFCSPLOWO2_01_FULL_40_18]
MVKVHKLVPEQSPFHPVNLYPVEGTAVRVTCEFSGNVDPHPSWLQRTWPEPDFVMVRGKVEFATETVMLFDTDPPSPEQLMVYVLVAEAEKDSVPLFFGEVSPFQLLEHEVAFTVPHSGVIEVPPVTEKELEWPLISKERVGVTGTVVIEREIGSLQSLGVVPNCTL